MPTPEPPEPDPDFTITMEAAVAAPIDPVAALSQLGAKWSPAFSRPGPLVITSRDCVLCGPAQDCRCHEVVFGSDEYFARLDKLHGRPGKATP